MKMRCYSSILHEIPYYGYLCIVIIYYNLSIAQECHGVHANRIVPSSTNRNTSFQKIYNHDNGRCISTTNNEWNKNKNKTVLVLRGGDITSDDVLDNLVNKLIEGVSLDDDDGNANYDDDDDDDDDKVEEEAILDIVANDAKAEKKGTIASSNNQKDTNICDEKEQQANSVEENKRQLPQQQEEEQKDAKRATKQQPEKKDVITTFQNKMNDNNVVNLVNEFENITAADTATSSTIRATISNNNTAKTNAPTEIESNNELTTSKAEILKHALNKTHDYQHNDSTKAAITAATNNNVTQTKKNPQPKKSKSKSKSKLTSKPTLKSDTTTSKKVLETTSTANTSPPEKTNHNTKPAVELQPPRPNAIYRYLLTKGYTGHVIILQCILLSNLLQRYLPPLYHLLVHISIKMNVYNPNEKPILTSSPTHQGNTNTRPHKPAKSKSKSKIHQQELDSIAMHKLQSLKKNTWSQEDIKYKYLTLKFMKRHGLGLFRNAEDKTEKELNDVGIESSSGTLLPNDVTKQDKKDEDEEEEDDHWVELALQPTSTSTKSKNKSSSTPNRMSFGVSFGTTPTSISKTKPIQAKKKHIKKKTSKKSQSNSIIGTFSDGISNSILSNTQSRRVLGTYPNDAVPIEEAANEAGVFALAKRYGYGHWSTSSSTSDHEMDDDDGEDESFTPDDSSRLKQIMLHSRKGSNKPNTNIDSTITSSLNFLSKAKEKAMNNLSYPSSSSSSSSASTKFFGASLSPTTYTSTRKKRKRTKPEDLQPSSLLQDIDTTDASRRPRTFGSHVSSSSFPSTTNQQDDAFTFGSNLKKKKQSSSHNNRRINTFGIPNTKRKEINIRRPSNSHKSTIRNKTNTFIGKKPTAFGSHLSSSNSTNRYHKTRIRKKQKKDDNGTGTNTSSPRTFGSHLKK